MNIAHSSHVKDDNQKEIHKSYTDVVKEREKFIIREGGREGGEGI